MANLGDRVSSRTEKPYLEKQNKSKTTTKKKKKRKINFIFFFVGK